jgi:DNA-binding transcriptional regulator YhcF (GntR family)
MPSIRLIQLTARTHQKKLNGCGKKMCEAAESKFRDYFSNRTKQVDRAYAVSVYTVYTQMHGTFTFSHSDKRPMYFQIMEQIKQRIMVGDWAEGQPIPSIRQLAVDLQVSVITVKRAYYELEREGVIITQHGKGSHVASTPGLGARLREQELEQHLEQAARIASQLGMTPKRLVERLREAGDRVAEKDKELI